MIWPLNFAETEMTFMDDTWADAEKVARIGANRIGLWLGTIAAVSPETSAKVTDALLQMAKECGWPTAFDETLALDIVLMPTDPCCNNSEKGCC